MESTSQTNNHGCFWYLFCCCLCDSSEGSTQERVAKATDPLLRTPDHQRYETMGERQVTFEAGGVSSPKGILRKAVSDPVLDRLDRNEEYRDAEELERTPLLRRREDLPKTPVGSPGSDGSNPNSPVNGQTLTVDYSQWGVAKGVSSPGKKNDDKKNSY